jgi:hypothetical protein
MGSLILPTKAHAASLGNSWDTLVQAPLSVSLLDLGELLGYALRSFSVTSAIRQADTGSLLLSATL